MYAWIPIRDAVLKSDDVMVSCQRVIDQHNEVSRASFTGLLVCIERD